MGSLVSCVACNFLGCCASEACKCCGRAVSYKKSIVTRVIYAFQLLIIALLAFFLEYLPRWTDNNFWLHHIPMLKTCMQPEDDKGNESKCFGSMAVYRLAFSLWVFHVFFCLALVKVKNSRDCRSSLQDEFFFFKFLILIALIIGSLFLPNSFFIWFAWASIFGAAIFILIQLVLLLDFAHTWNETWVGYFEETGNKIWAVLLISSTTIMFLVALVLTILLYVFWGKCDTNITFISLNLVLCLGITLFSIHPKLQELNPRSGLLQSALTCLYCTYLVWSAIMSEPNDPEDPHSFNCGKSSAIGGGKGFGVAIGLVLTVIAVLYSTFRMSTSSESLSLGSKSDLRGAIVPDEEDVGTAYPDENDLDEDKRPLTGKRITEDDLQDDELESVKYNYSFFHFSYATAAMYLVMLLTNWDIIKEKTGEVETGVNKHIQIDSGMVSVWVKMVTSWLTLVLYIWTLLAPVLFPNREF